MEEGKAPDVSLVTRVIRVGDREVYVTEEKREVNDGQGECDSVC